MTGAGFQHLLVQPLRVRLSGDSRMDKLARAVVDDKEHVQRTKPQRLNGKQVASPDLLAILGKELSPTRGGRSTIGEPHVLGDGAGTNRNA